MAASNAAVERWAPRLICWSVSKAKKRSTWLIHDADVGVKCSGCRGEVHMPAEPFGEPVADQFGLMARGIVHDGVDVGIGGQNMCSGRRGDGGRCCPAPPRAVSRDGSRAYLARGAQVGSATTVALYGTA